MNIAVLQPDELDVVHLSTVHQWNDPRVLTKECASAAKAGYKVGLIVTEPPENTYLGVKLIGIKRRSSRIGRMTLGVATCFVEALKSRAPIVHFHDPELIPAGGLLRLFGRKVIFDVHEDYITSIKIVSKNIPAPLKKILSFCYRASVPVQRALFSIIIAEKYYSEHYPKAVPVLNYPDLTLFEKFQSQERMPPQKPRLLYTGNVTKVRGALNHVGVVNRLESGSLTIIGRCDPNLLPSLETEERVVLPSGGGYAAFADIVEAYSEEWTAGLAIFPPTEHYTRKELTKIYEYAAAGIPTICSDFPVWKELVEGNGIGFCVDPTDPDAAHAVVEKLTNDADLYKKTSKRALEFAHKHTTWQKEADKLVGLYGDLIDRK
ncbi:glycosyltransferase family 4 protein [Roseibium sp. MMSF_3412]|uniref:glycosyltransferase family 4 protein n=1 Tax=Roseibium sp. MMSF_3412 TaxID=3046712 RepID=UPI00274008EB|nr:glycosyltransferase family 4 protein [Roseibium sp. MMSF_3412]